MTKKNCVHHWIIDVYDVGRCKYCGEVKDFRRMQKRTLEGRKEYLRQNNPHYKRGKQRKGSLVRRSYE